MVLKKNVHKLERLLRAGIGFGCIYIGLIETNIIDNLIINLVIAGFGALNLISAIAGICPVYLAAGISTVPKKNKTT